MMMTRELNCKPPRLGEDWQPHEWQLVDRVIMALRRNSHGAVEIRRGPRGSFLVYHVKRDALDEIMVRVDDK